MYILPVDFCLENDASRCGFLSWKRWPSFLSRKWWRVKAWLIMWICQMKHPFVLKSYAIPYYISYTILYNAISYTISYTILYFTISYTISYAISYRMVQDLFIYDTTRTISYTILDVRCRIRCRIRCRTSWRTTSYVWRTTSFKTYDIVGFYPIVANRTYDIVYDVVYDVVRTTYDIVYDIITT